MDYMIFCVLPDDKPTFAVEIPKTQTVAQLMNAIKDEKAPSLKARDLTLYKVDLDCSDRAEYMKQAKSLARNPGNLLALEPPKKLTTIFGLSGPLEEKIHILVVPPPGEPTDSRALS